MRNRLRIEGKIQALLFPTKIHAVSELFISQSTTAYFWRYIGLLVASPSKSSHQEINKSRFWCAHAPPAVTWGCSAVSFDCGDIFWRPASWHRKHDYVSLEDRELMWYMRLWQDELVLALRSDGRRQAARRMLRMEPLTDLTCMCACGRMSWCRRCAATGGGRRRSACCA